MAWFVGWQTTPTAERTCRKGDRVIFFQAVRMPAQNLGVDGVTDFQLAAEPELTAMLIIEFDQ
jgi:hypothetical protein